MELTVSLLWRPKALEDRLPFQIANADIKIHHYCAFLLSFSLHHVTSLVHSTHSHGFYVTACTNYDFHLSIERERDCKQMGAAILILVSQILDSQICIAHDAS